MLGRTHMVGGAVAYAAAALPSHVNHTHLAAGAGVAAVAALLPDLDHPGSKVARAGGPPTRLLAKAIGKLAGGHRKATHSLAAVLVLALPTVAFLPSWAAGAVLVGYLSHLATDTLTPGGVPWLWPHPYRLAVPITKTGAWPETIIRHCLWIGLALLALDHAGQWPHVETAWHLLV